ncbi:hypothetical protein TNCV_2247261 [Trichonephila clavipes]|nr:hypothetical protein TNCV_2247261 [Trichonephila clavipes]
MGGVEELKLRVLVLLKILRVERLMHVKSAEKICSLAWCGSHPRHLTEVLNYEFYIHQMNSLAASVKLTYSASMVDRLTDFCLKVRHEIGVSSITVMNPPIDTRSSLFVAKSESE